MGHPREDVGKPKDGGCRKLEEARVGEVGHFRKHQQIVAPEALRTLPLIAVFVEAGKGDIVPRLFVGSIAPNRSLDATDPEGQLA